MSASFSPVEGASGLWTLDGATGAAFYAADGGTGALTLDQAWALRDGVFAFVPGAVDATLAEPLADFAALRPGVRFAWVANPQDPARAWNAATIAFGADGVTTRDLAPIALRSLQLAISPGCAAAVGGDDASIALTAPHGAADRIWLSAGWGAETWDLSANPLTVSLDGAAAGCITTSITLDNTTDPPDFDRLDVGLRVFEPNPDSAVPSRLRSSRFPLFQLAGGPVPAAKLDLPLSLDPLQPDGTAPGRTFIGLVPSGETAGAEIGTNYQTAAGGYVLLTPLADGVQPPARLVLAARALGSPPNPYDPAYLVPSGAFQIRVTDAGGNDLTKPQRLLCGLSGVEYIGLDTAGASRLWFTPGGAALAQAQGIDTTATAVTTAYASVFPHDDSQLTYQAQPDAATLFQPGGSDNRFLAYYERPGRQLPAAPVGGTLPPGFPMLAFAGLGEDDHATLLRLEQGAVAPARRALIGGPSKNQQPAPAADAVGATTTTATTPQGLLATLTGNAMAVSLAQSRSGACKLAIGQVSDTLADALATNQLFLVASLPDKLGSNATGLLTIPAAQSDVWSFDAFPSDGWEQRGTLLVMKFAGRPLRELAADTSAWSGADALNTDKSDTCRQLVAFVDDAIARSAHVDELKPFAALVQDRDWHGILVLNCQLPGLPNQIAGLLAGIDQSQFRAHHLGITVTPVQPGSSTITPQDSSLFGLIDDESATSAAGGKPPYYFQVDSLKVRFENSAVATFSSRIELLVDELFGEQVTLSGSKSGNVLALEGFYQREDTQAGVAGSFSFQTTADNTFTFTDASGKPTSAVLHSVDVARAAFVTVKPPASGDPKAPAESRFAMSGALRFLPPAGSKFDLFSYGPEPGETPPSAGRLFFTNLAIDLGYVPDDRSQDVYTFDATALVIDPAQSAARPGGLFGRFPLTPSGFVHVQPPAPKSDTKAPTPASLGFLGVQTPIPQASIAPPWFGIVADLGIGSAGALAAKAGFKAQMLAAWAPGGPAQANVAAGLKLPGTSQAPKLLSLENVLKLKIAELELLQDGETYVLWLDRITLSVLSVSLPPSGQTELLLFADPGGHDHTTLGWYAGYAKTGGSK